ncbi:MAG: DUF3014 domain-containing protein [Bacteriovorax sp.]
MKNDKIVTPFLVSILASIIVGFFSWTKLHRDTHPVPATHSVTPAATKIIPFPATPPKKTPEIKYPIDSSLKGISDADIDKEPIPKVEDSDLKIQNWANRFFGKLDIKNIFIFKNFIDRFVVFIVNASGKIIPMNMSPMTIPSEKFVAKHSGEDFELSEENYKRYRPYVELAKAADLKKVVAFYRRMYPLFQSSYREQGEEGYFNDRLVGVIDVALATPEINKPIKLFYSNSQYEFVDSKLESLMAIQKILIRMGPDNLKTIKSRFKELRNLLAG